MSPRGSHVHHLLPTWWILGGLGELGGVEASWRELVTGAGPWGIASPLLSCFLVSVQGNVTSYPLPHAAAVVFCSRAWAQRPWAEASATVSHVRNFRHINPQCVILTSRGMGLESYLEQTVCYLNVCLIDPKHNWNYLHGLQTEDVTWRETTG